MLRKRVVHHWFACFAMLGACSCLAELSDPVTFINPVLSGLSIRQYPFRFQVEWGVEVTGTAEPLGYVLTEDMRVSARVTTSAGDIEEIWLRPYLCSEGDKEYVCLSFALSMERGHHVEELRPFLDQVQAKFSYVLNDGTWGEMTVLGKEDLNSAMRTVRAWPGVAYAEPESVGRVSTRPAPSDVRLVTLMSVAFENPSPNDGVVQARPGDIVTVEYQQPDSTATLSASLTMCATAPEGGGVPIVGLGQDPPCS